MYISVPALKRPKGISFLKTQPVGIFVSFSGPLPLLLSSAMVLQRTQEWKHGIACCHCYCCQQCYYYGLAIRGWSAVFLACNAWDLIGNEGMGYRKHRIAQELLLRSMPELSATQQQVSRNERKG